MQEDCMRNWRQIAKELTDATDQKKVIALSEELDRAIEEQGLVSQSEKVPSSVTAAKKD